MPELQPSLCHPPSKTYIETFFLVFADQGWDLKSHHIPDLVILYYSPSNHDISYYLVVVNSSTMLLIIRSTLRTLDVKTVNSSTMLLIIRSMLRMQHIKTVNSSTMLFINHTIDTSSSRWHSLSVYCNWRNRKFYYYYSKNKKPGGDSICLTFSNKKCLLYTYLV